MKTIKQKEEFEKAFGTFAEKSGIADTCRIYHTAKELEILMVSLREWLFDNYSLQKKGEKND